MGPKSKLHQKTGKPKTLPLPTSTTSNNDQLEQTSSPEILAQQFELELCWCIQQLQKALKSSKLNAKQVQDHTKALNTLMSTSAPLVKKRQVMRLSFGDYRAKMRSEDKKLTTVTARIKVSTASPSKNSVFLKKSAFLTSGSDFRFNFAQPEADDITQEISNVKISGGDDKKSEFSFQPCSNSFKFNFNVSE